MSANIPTLTDADSNNESVTDEADGNTDVNGKADGDITTNLVRESADGGSTQSLTQNANTEDVANPTEEDSSVKEKKNENADNDLDKDIDVMIERNTENGFINPDASTTISSIQVDLTTDSLLDQDDEDKAEGKDADDLNANQNGDSKQKALEAQAQSDVTDKSFTSSTDSSVVAEAVVKKVLNNALTEFSTHLSKDARPANVGVDTVIDINPPKTDVKVGLFQYGGTEDIEHDRSDSEEEEEENFESLDNVESKPKELKVGLFQYSEAEDVKSPEVIDLDDNDESHEEGPQEDILKLYGLEGLDPVSPKSASPPESGPTSVEDSNDNKVIDVQREIYEPQTRLFSITKSSSSAGSTPRNGVAEINNQDESDKIDQLFTSAKQSENNHESILDDSDNDSYDTPTGSMQLDTKLDDRDTVLSESKPSNNGNYAQQQDVSPPLVQYEPVNDNGKFRIVKTVKEGGPIRIGTSPNLSPREIGSQGSPESIKPDALSPKNESLNQEAERKQGQDNLKRMAAANESRSANDAKETEQIDKDLIRELIARERISDLIPTRDSGISTSTGMTQTDISTRLADERKERLSPNQMSLSELREPSENKNRTTGNNYSPREATLGGESEPDSRQTTLRDQGRQPYTDGQRGDAKAFERQYKAMLEKDSYFARSYNKDRYTSEELSRDVSEASSRYQASSFSDTHYDTSTQRPVEPVRQQQIKATDTETSPDYRQEPVKQPTKSLNTKTSPDYVPEPVRQQQIRPVDSGVIPVYKNLQEQQAKWSAMFRQLESEHRHELRSQYDRHQANIKRLQQQMEHELQKQHVAIRKKLDLHKEALAKMSPDRDRVSPDRRYRSPDRSMSPVGHERSHDRSHNQRDNISGATDLSTLHNSQNSKTWREIYQEVRAEESDMDPEPSPRLQRALDSEFASVDTSTDRSRSTLSRPSPRGRSRERDITIDDTARSFRDGFPSSYEEKMSRSMERESRSISKVKRSGSPSHQLDAERLNLSTGSPGGREDVSPHIQELLDNLKDSQRSLQGLEEDMGSKPGAVSKSPRSKEVSAEKPRAGVYSSPMPVFKGKGSKPSEKPVKDFSSSLPVTRQARQSSDTSFYTDTDRRRSVDYRDTRERDLSRDSFNIEDILSSSERLNLREKHSKHLADLRAYYEEELRELRKALSDSMETVTPTLDMSMQSTIQNQLLEAENKHLLDKCKTMEDELEELYAKVRTSEQKNKGLEKRASEYAAAFADSQAMGIQHRAHIEELQRYCRERDDLVNDLESKVRSQEDGVKLYKKSLDEEMELHRQDKIALQRITDKYESLDRDYKLLQETMTSTENKLYEARTEIVDLNRAMSKMELENKRLGRENDNLRHKVTQSLNLSTMHESFGSPSSPREADLHISRTKPVSQSQNHIVNDSHTKPTDERLPAFTGAHSAWTCTEKSNTTNRAKMERGVASNTANKSNTSAIERKEKREPKARGQKSIEGNSIRKGTGYRSSSEDIQRDSRQERCRPAQEEQIPVRDITPPRPSSSQSQAESEISDYSPLLKAERELFKLRDMMRQAVAVKPSSSPPPPKLQKKFYGSERPANKDDYTPDLGQSRGRKEVPNSHNSVAKTKSTQSKSDRAVPEKSNKKSAQSRSDRSSTKSKDRSDDREKERKERTKEEEKQGVRTPPRRKPISSVNPEVYDSPTRFDISVNEKRKGDNSSLKKGDNYKHLKQRNLFESDQDSLPEREEPAGAASRNDRTKPDQNDKVTNTLDMMRNGQFTTRPEWEDMFTSMVKPKPEHQEKVKAMTSEDKVKDRLRTISEMESRYDGLQMEKRQLESSINKIPLHGRVDRNSRRQKEQLEERLDSVEKELGSLKMSLKRYNVLKTAG